MNPLKKMILRSAIAAVAILGLTTSVFARGSQIRVILNCNHEDRMEMRNVPTPSPEDPETTTPMPHLVLEVAGAGVASHMRGAVVCISQDYAFNLITGVGSATFKLRDCAGDVLAYKAELVMLPSADGKHFAEFEGTYTIDSAACTGRFAGAIGDGLITGWANQDATNPASGQGFAEMIGSINFKKPACKK